jgi:flagellar biosynthesis protein FlhF
MKIKSYFANSIQQAIQMARQELGPEAMLLNTKMASGDARRLGAYEVVFGLAHEETPSSPPQSSATDPGRVHSQATGVDRLSTDLSDLRRAVERMVVTFSRAARLFHSWPSQEPEWLTALAELTSCDVDADTALEVLGRAAGRPGPLASALREEVSSYCRADSQLGSPGSARRIVALAGPAGAGKTSVIASLAIRYGIYEACPVELLSADSERIGASLRLQSYAAILGLPLREIASPADLARCVDHAPADALLLIDTPPYDPPEGAYWHSLATWLAGRNDVDRQLVLPFSMKTADLMPVVERYQVFRPHKLILTHADATSSRGLLLACMRLLRLPVSFVSCGPEVPDDLQPAETLDLADLALGHSVKRKAASAAA